MPCKNIGSSTGLLKPGTEYTMQAIKVKITRTLLNFGTRPNILQNIYQFTSAQQSLKVSELFSAKFKEYTIHHLVSVKNEDKQSIFYSFENLKKFILEFHI